MKKILTMLMVASIFSLVACGPSEEEKAKTAEDANTAIEEITNGLEESEATTDEVADADLPEHVCDAKCKEEGCTGPRCGEKGHVCTDACKAAKEEATTEEEAPAEEATTE